MTAAAVARAAWDVFLLRDRERVAASCAVATRDEVRALARAGRARAEVAERLLEGHFTSALTLYRESAVFYLAAAVAARTGASPPDPLRGDDVLARFEQLYLPLSRTPGGAAFLDYVRAPDPRAVERLAPAEAAQAAREARRVVRAAAALVEPRDAGEIRFVRRARVAALGLVGLVPLALVGLFVASRLGGPNLALHKPVEASGLYVGSASPLGGLTDGVTTGSYGAHTKVGEVPWLSVDLQGVFLIKKVKVYNRGDGWFDDALPVTVQLSLNGKDFVDVGTRTTTFGQLVPWTLKVGHQRARWVRVRGADGKYLALSELEVFGDRP
jgi:F5/8 type C domain-containing protein